MELTLIVVSLLAIAGGLVVAASVLRWAAVHRNDLLTVAAAHLTAYICSGCRT